MHRCEDESARCRAHPQGCGVTRALMGVLTVGEGTVGGLSGLNSVIRTATHHYHFWARTGGWGVGI